MKNVGLTAYVTAKGTTMDLIIIQDHKISDRSDRCCLHIIPVFVFLCVYHTC